MNHLSNKAYFNIYTNGWNHKIGMLKGRGRQRKKMESCRFKYQALQNLQNKLTLNPCQNLPNQYQSQLTQKHALIKASKKEHIKPDEKPPKS